MDHEAHTHVQMEYKLKGSSKEIRKTYKYGMLLWNYITPRYITHWDLEEMSVMVKTEFSITSLFIFD